MPKMRTKDKIFFGYSMGKVNSRDTSIEVYYEGDRMLEEAISRNKIMHEITALAWKMNIKSKESHRINWHYARRHKETIPQLEKLLTDMKLEYVIQQAGGLDE